MTTSSPTSTRSRPSPETTSLAPAGRAAAANPRTGTAASPSAAGRPERRRRTPAALVPFLALSVAGCIEAALGTSTGSAGAESWSDESKQQAHVGESVSFRLVLIDQVRGRPVPHLELADYCLASIGDERIVCDPDIDGRFDFTYRLADAKPGDAIKITAAAYRQYGVRDYVQLGSHWMRGDSPYDEPDGKVRSDTITLKVYQARVEVPVPAGPAFNFDSGRLELIRADGDVTAYQRARPDRPGFEVDSTSGTGYKIVLTPAADDLNPSGRTLARFTVFDDDGLAHRFETLIETP